MFNNIKWFIIRHMKYVMVAIFTVCMGAVVYLFTFTVSNINKMAQDQLILLWIASGLLLLASIVSIWRACILGQRDDDREIERVITELDLANKIRKENPPMGRTEARKKARDMIREGKYKEW